MFIQFFAMIFQFGQTDRMRLVAMAGLAGSRVAVVTLPRMWAPPLSPRGGCVTTARHLVAGSLVAGGK